MSKEELKKRYIKSISLIIEDYDLIHLRIVHKIILFFRHIIVFLKGDLI